MILRKFKKCGTYNNMGASQVNGGLGRVLHTIPKARQSCSVDENVHCNSIEEPVLYMVKRTHIA